MKALEAALELIKLGVIEVRQDGTVWKLRNLKGPLLSQPRRLECLSKRGYLMVRVMLDGKNYLIWAHRLVWTALRGPIPMGLEPNHEDGNKLNNHPANLTLVTRGENHRHAYLTGLKTRTDVPRDISQDAKRLRAQGLSYSAIAATLGVSQTTAFRATRI